MPVIEDLDEEECYLWAILSDPSGLDQAEFLWHDAEQGDGCFRAWAFQWDWWRNTDNQQIDQCFPEGSLVLTSDGHKSIEAVEIGDLVWTHEGRWRPVTYIFDRGEQETVVVDGYGHFGLEVTEDHEIFTDQGKVAASDLAGNRWLSPLLTDTTGTVPELDRVYKSGASNLPDVSSPSFFWLLGLYVAEGSTSSTYGKGGKVNRITWSVSLDEHDTVAAHLDAVGVNWNTDYPKSGGCVNFHVICESWATMLGEFGRGASNKRLPGYVFRLPDANRQNVFDGVMFGDGCRRGEVFEYTTVSRSLCFDVKVLGQSLGYSSSVYVARAAGTMTIQGRIVNTETTYGVALTPLSKQRAPRLRNEPVGYSSKVRAVRRDGGRARCYDLEVLEDHSFVVEGVVVSNCARSVGKSLSIKVRSFAFPFLHPGQEMVITAPEGNHLEAITDNVETQFINTTIGTAMLKGGRVHGSIKHKPFHMNFANGARIMGRIPQHDGKGVKGCEKSDGPVLTSKGIKRADEIIVGDLVMNHENRWVPVTGVFPDVNDCYRVEGAGSFPMEVSCDHRFFGADNLGTVKTKRDFSDGLYFADVEHLIEDQFYWASPTSFPFVEPVYPSFSSKSKSYNYESEEFWWLAGLYVADGYVRGNGKTEISAINWISHPRNQGRKKLIRNLESLGCNYRITKRSHSSADQIEVTSSKIATWAADQFGRTALTKSLPAFMFTLPEGFRTSFLDGYLAGDGYWNDDKSRWEVSSASKNLAISIQLLAQSLGYKVACSSVDPKVSEISGRLLKNDPKTSWRVYISENGHSHEMAGPNSSYLVGKVKKVVPIGKHPVVDIRVADGHSYLSGAIMSHNIHPVWLELDEAQDYPEKGWTEIFETLKRGSDGVWRAHGVTRGGRDAFFKFTQEAAGWTVHRFCLPSDTLIYGVAGPERIEDIRVGTKIYSVEPDDSGAPTLTVGEVTGKTCNGVQPTWTIVTCDRELTGTFNHPVMVLKDSTKRKRKKVEIEWRSLSDVRPGDYVVEFVEGGLSSGNIMSPSVSAGMESFSTGRNVPEYVWFSSDDVKRSFLNGYLIADGSLSKQVRGQDALAVNAASRDLVRGLRVLAQYLGLRTTKMRPHVTRRPDGSEMEMYRFYIYPGAADFRQFPSDCTTHELEMDGRLAVRKVLESASDESEQLTWDIEVGDKHNFIAEGIVTHNTAMHRPTWTNEERETAIQNYGSREHPDYRRNVLGLHGDVTAPFFVLHRLMACVDQDTMSDLNEKEWTQLKINNEMILDVDDNILNLLDFPRSHTKYKNIWIGMDVGYMRDPSEILVFAEEKGKKKDDPTTMKLISRVSMERVNHGNQVNAILWLIEFYKPRAFSMDKTGLGLPLFQDIQERTKRDPKIEALADRIKGYNFSEKILVDFDETVEIDEYLDDPIKEAGMHRNVLEYSSDKLRDLVDSGRLILPFDVDLINEFKGQSFSYDNNQTEYDQYGRKRKWSTGSFHRLDAARMAVLGWAQYSIEELVSKERFEPVREVFLY